MAKKELTDEHLLALVVEAEKAGVAEMAHTYQLMGKVADQLKIARERLGNNLKAQCGESTDAEGMHITISDRKVEGGWDSEALHQHFTEIGEDEKKYRKEGYITKVIRVTGALLGRVARKRLGI